MDLPGRPLHPLHPSTRLLLAAGCFGAWLALLFLGHAVGGAIHLLALAGVVLVPWRRAQPLSPHSPHSHAEES